MVRKLERKWTLHFVQYIHIEFVYVVSFAYFLGMQRQEIVWSEYA